MTYEEFLKRKSFFAESHGFEQENLNPMLFDFQRDLVRWSLRKGRAALFTMTGTGKTAMQCEWAEKVADHTGSPVLILAPLAVSRQTVKEALKFGIDVHPCRNQDDVQEGINITNYEMLDHFNPGEFSGIVLDESSILKAYDGKIRTQIIDSFKNTPYRLSATATPAPNDFMELGNQSEFLGVMTRSEMLSMFFVHDGGDTAKWRLKGHAQRKYWEWMASWAAVMSSPSDLGYSDKGFILPPLNIYEEIVESTATSGHLFALPSMTLQERQQARRDTIDERVKRCADIVNSTDRPFLVWCDLNSESEKLRRQISGAAEVKGSDSVEWKEKAVMGFVDGSYRVLISKPSMFGFGLNFQHCSNMAFVGLSDSFEQYFQAVRRCWRFGQKSPVNVHIIISELEGAVRTNIERKERDAMRMISEMISLTKDIVKNDLQKTKRWITEYQPEMNMVLPGWPEVGGSV